MSCGLISCGPDAIRTKAVCDYGINQTYWLILADTSASPHVCPLHRPRVIVVPHCTTRHLLVTAKKCCPQEMAQSCLWAELCPAVVSPVRGTNPHPSQKLLSHPFLGEHAALAGQQKEHLKVFPFLKVLRPEKSQLLLSSWQDMLVIQLLPLKAQEKFLVWSHPHEALKHSSYEHQKRNKCSNSLGWRGDVYPRSLREAKCETAEDSSQLPVAIWAIASASACREAATNVEIPLLAQEHDHVALRHWSLFALKRCSSALVHIQDEIWKPGGHVWGLNALLGQVLRPLSIPLILIPLSLFCSTLFLLCPNAWPLKKKKSLLCFLTYSPKSHHTFLKPVLQSLILTFRRSSWKPACRQPSDFYRIQQHCLLTLRLSSSGTLSIWETSHPQALKAIK